jgi:DNA-binding CsgD family transcriptional regulator
MSSEDIEEIKKALDRIEASVEHLWNTLLPFMRNYNSFVEHFIPFAISIKETKKQIEELNEKFDLYLRTRTRKMNALTARQDQVLKILKENPNISLKELASKLNISHSYVCFIVKALKRKGCL